MVYLFNDLKLSLNYLSLSFSVLNDLRSLSLQSSRTFFFSSFFFFFGDRLRELGCSSLNCLFYHGSGQRPVLVLFLTYHTVLCACYVMLVLCSNHAAGLFGKQNTCGDATPSKMNPSSVLIVRACLVGCALRKWTVTMQGKHRFEEVEGGMEAHSRGT